MTIYRSLHQLPKLAAPVLTIGNFDGVHLGHRALFSLVRSRAAAIGGTSMVMTFWPHPLRVLSGKQGPPLITMLEQKLELIHESGIDAVLCLRFTPELAAMEPDDFVRLILVERIGIREIVIGYDYTFGRKARGNRELLQRMGQDYGFTVHTVSAQPGPDGVTASSTHVRELVMEGRVEDVPVILGRPYRIEGLVVRGRDRGGKLLGFPTANLKLVDELVPRNGVYAVRVHLGPRVIPGVANIGHNPTFNDTGLSIEVHCFDFHEDIYGQSVRVDFMARIRDEKKFSGPEELTGQIRADCQTARQILHPAP